ncbi:MAG: D-glycero-beta-D-manno-heptose 1,7-bisphosphate 7-phosphatase [Candidatus Margulisiibacteriota bacterium]
MNKAVFLDRDGTIIEDTGYLNHPVQVSFLPGAIAAIKRLKEAGYKIIIISNQAGIARGLITEDMLQSIDKHVHKMVLHGGGQIDASYYCPHHPEHGVYPYRQSCECRKPQTGLIKRAAKEHDLDLAKCFMVGDKKTDVETGQRAEIKTIFVRTGHGKNEEKELKEKPDHLAADLAAAVDWILKQGADHGTAK